jgi:hypothetical protein
VKPSVLAGRRRASFAVLLAFAMPGASQAQPMPAATPFVTPQRDVDVTYLIARPGNAGDPPGIPGPAMTQRMRWSAALWRQRIDPPGAAIMITDYRRHELLVIDPVRRQALRFPAPNRVLPPGVRASGPYTRLGDQVVAGTPCTEWRTPDASGVQSQVCFTADGVLLRARHDAEILMQAVQVHYAIQDPALFSPAPDVTVQAPSSR